MKKNKTNYVIIVLLVLLLISLAFIGYSLAKYVTRASIDDDVRVAKWGITIDTPESMFKSSYQSEDPYSLEDVVVSFNGDVLVAPGTSGSLGKIVVHGIPEVASVLTINSDKVNSKLIGWDYDPDNTGHPYEPVLWYIMGYNDIFQLYADTFSNLLSEINKVNIYFEPNTPIDQQSLEIYWEWPFESGNDEGDTYYGDKAASGEPLSIILKFDILLIQID